MCWFVYVVVPELCVVCFSICMNGGGGDDSMCAKVSECTCESMIVLGCVDVRFGGVLGHVHVFVSGPLPPYFPGYFS